MNDFAYAQDDINLRILRMFEGTFLLNAIHCVIAQYIPYLNSFSVVVPQQFPAGTWRLYNVALTQYAITASYVVTLVIQ